MTTLFNIKNQINTINNEIADYITNEVCPRISSSKEVDWIFLGTSHDKSKDTLSITAKNPNAFGMPGGTIVIDFKDGAWFFNIASAKPFTFTELKTANVEQILKFNYAMSKLMYYGEGNKIMNDLNKLIMKRQALYQSMLELSK